MAKGQPKPLERDIQAAILDYLLMVWVPRGACVWRSQPPAVRRAWGGGTSIGIHRTEPGVPDISVVFRGRYIGLEVKRPGGKQRPTQAEFQQRLERSGGWYHIVRSVEDTQSVMEGLP